jgi:hypothetical protein
MTLPCYLDNKLLANYLIIIRSQRDDEDDKVWSCGEPAWTSKTSWRSNPSPSSSLSLGPRAVYTKMDVHATSTLHFWCSILAQKATKTTFPVDLVSYPNSPGVNCNHQTEVGVHMSWLSWLCCILAWIMYCV